MTALWLIGTVLGAFPGAYLMMYFSAGDAWAYIGGMFLGGVAGGWLAIVIGLSVGLRLP